MTRARKLCLVLDVFAVLGLSLVVAAWICVRPRPLWTAVVDREAAIIGFSNDSRHVYLLNDYLLKEKHRPSPRIERWDVKTRSRDEYPLQVPTEELALLEPGKKDGVAVALVANRFVRKRDYLSASLHLDPWAVENPYLFRLYDIDSGRSVSSAYTFMTNAILSDILPDSGNQPPMGLFCYPDSIRSDAVQVRDLITGKLVHSMGTQFNRMIRHGIFCGDDHLILLWCSSPSTEQTEYELSIHRLDTWEEIAHKPLGRWLHNERTGFHLSALSNNRFIVHSQGINDKLLFLEVCHLYDRGQVRDVSRLLMAMEEGLFQIKNGLVILKRTRNTKWWPDAWPWLASFLERCGLDRPQSNKRHDVIVRDADSGRLLRQLTDYGQGDLSIIVSDDGCYLATVELSDPNDRVLMIYDIPHYLWEWTWTFFKYAAWLLVLPWPLHLFFAHAERRRTAGNVLVPPLLSKALA